MIFTNRKKKEFINTFKSVTKHPYFGFILIISFFLLINFLNVTGVIGISTARALGQTMIYSIVALGFSILLGYSGLASLGTAGFIGLGSYFLGYMVNNLRLPFELIVVISIVFAIVIGVIVGFISLRIEGMYLAIITLGLSEILTEIFKKAKAFTNGTDGLKLSRFYVLGFELDRNFTFIFIAFVLLIMMMLTLNIIKSPMGRAMLAMKNSESAAQSMGVNILKHRLLAFIISTIYAVIAGILYMAYYEFSIPTTWSLALSLNILAAVIVGGARSIFGVILGVFVIFGFDQAVLQQIPFFVKNPNITYILNGVIIILVVMFYPGGLVRLLTTLKFKIQTLIKKLMKQYKEYRYGIED